MEECAKSAMISFSDILATVSLLISFGATVYVSVVSNRQNKKNLDSVYFNELFKKYLLKKIPYARTNIEVINQNLIGSNELLQVLRDIKKDAVYYSFCDQKFHNKLRIGIEELENYINSNEMQSVVNKQLFMDELEVKINKIYSVCGEKYGTK